MKPEDYYFAQEHVIGFYPEPI